MKILTLDNASGYGGQQYYVDDKGKFAGLVPANQPTTPATTSVQIGSGPQETYTGIDTSNLNQFSGTGGTDTAVIDGQTFQNFDTQAFTAANQVPVNPPQTMDDLTSALSVAQDLNLDPAQRFKNRTSDLTGVTYGDKKAFEYDLGDAYDNIVAVRSGDSLKFFQDGERLDRDQTANALGIDVLSLNSLDSGNQKISSLFNQLRDQETQEVYDQFGGVEGDLVSQYLQDQAATAKRRADADERSDERDAKRFEDLRNQVSKEAEALGISVKDYYELPFTMRARMAGSDIAELFKGDNSGLGVLGDVNLAKYQEEALPYKGKGGNDPLDFTGFEQRYADDGVTPPLGGGFTIPGTNITITAPEGDMSSGGGYGGGAGSGSGDQYGRRPKFGAFANISGGGGGGIWDRFRNSYLTEYGLEGESADIDEIKVRYDPESGVYFYPDGTPIDPADLEGLDISDTFQEQTGTERFKL